MKRLFLGVALLIAGLARADKIDELRADGSYCWFFARQAVYGATQQMRGAPMSFQYLSRDGLIELIEHDGQVGANALYVLDENGDYTEQEKRAIEDAVSYGYEQMVLWRQEHEPPTKEAWEQMMFEACGK